MREKKLVDELEVLGEQHNGLTVRLQRAKRAAKVARDSSDQAQTRFEELRGDVAKLAAQSYMSGSLDQVSALVATDDPQRLLDQYSALNYLSVQGNDRLTVVLGALQRVQRTRKAADDRISQVGLLTKESDGKRRKIEVLLRSVRKKLGKPPASPKDPPPNVQPGKASAKAMKAVNAALAQLGVPYSWGGGNAAGPSFGTAQGANIKGFDCSGLTLYAYAQVGINLPHYTGDQWKMGTRVTRAQLQPGDLVFFHSDLHHMGLYIGDGKMVHAPQTGDTVRISTIDDRPFTGGVRLT
ncbi:C40 family peptidase [Actinocorallia longicatena]|uniref:C40 family peptidase n=1 Tax=Actinocorallia longicatena TaxID=111803 RepID=A0ABP6PXL0_9ACTN